MLVGAPASDLCSFRSANTYDVLTGLLSNLISFLAAAVGRLRIHWRGHPRGPRSSFPGRLQAGEAPCPERVDITKLRPILPASRRRFFMCCHHVYGASHAQMSCQALPGLQALRMLIRFCLASQRALKDESANQVSINFFGDGTANNGASLGVMGEGRPQWCGCCVPQWNTVHATAKRASYPSSSAKFTGGCCITFVGSKQCSDMRADLPCERARNTCAGQFYECLNMATLYKLPCIFVVENNKWAIGMSHARATGPSAIQDEEPYIYKKGPAFGMPGVLVDGMDVRKVRAAFSRVFRGYNRPCSATRSSSLRQLPADEGHKTAGVFSTEAFILHLLFMLTSSSMMLFRCCTTVCS